jgi:hypothetical protein
VSNAFHSTWASTPGNISILKRAARLTAYNARKAHAAEVARVNAAREQMGPDTAEAAYPGKGEGKAIDNDLAGRMQKAKIPDITVTQDDTEEED